MLVTVTIPYTQLDRDVYVFLYNGKTLSLYEYRYEYRWSTNRPWKVQENYHRDDPRYTTLQREDINVPYKAINMALEKMNTYAEFVE